ncbi:MAG: LPS-assembly protein LptD [Gallionellaceae bacterium]
MMRFCPSAVALFVIFSIAPAAFAEDGALLLKLDRKLTKVEKNQEETPIFMSAMQIDGKIGEQIEGLGDVELRKRGQAIYANRMRYLVSDKEVEADDAVRIEQDNDVMKGPHLRLNLDTDIGDMTQPQFWLGSNHARGQADLLRLNGRENYSMNNVTYTTCPEGQDDWLLKMGELDIDRSSQIGVARNAEVVFMGVPILYSPWMNFALNAQRKSGFLGPVFGSTGQGGTDLTLPYYWNIAPNRDATFSPRIIAKRGIMLNNEFRFMGSTYAGEADLDVLPGDRLANQTRTRIALTDSQNFGHGLVGLVNLNKVSDDAYFRDLANSVSGTSLTTLPRQAVLSYTKGWWNASAQVQSFQTLQDPAAPVVVPYNMLPQLSVGAQRALGKAEVNFAGEFVDFRHPTSISGRRVVLYPSVSYALIAEPAFYLTPKIGLHNTHYTLDANNSGALPDSSRSLPIFSLDGGMTLEREWNLNGRNFIQTLEPRAFYVYIPYRNQSLLPNFDSAQAEFNFAQIFTENRFYGSDRIGDANQLTLGLTSRLLDPASGAEKFRIAVGERFSVTTPEVNLVAPTETTNKSDILFAASGQLTGAWSLDGFFQYDPSQAQAVQFDAATRYRPESGKVLNLGYRFTRNTLRQIEMSTQWPLYRHWQGVAQLNYSLQDRQILEALGGLEYNLDCWAVRLVAQRFVTATQQYSTGVFVQLELNGLVMLGSDPLALLRQSIPGYTKLNEPNVKSQMP